MKFNPIFTEDLYQKHLHYLKSGDIVDRLTFKQVDLSHTDFSNADLTNAVLTDCNLHNSNLNGCIIRLANLSKSILTYSKLTFLDFKNVNLDNVDLSNANVEYANLKYSTLNNVVLSGANLYGANLFGSSLINVKLDGARITKVIGDGNIIKTLQFPPYHVNVTSTVLSIGCKTYPIDVWYNFTDEQIDAMDEGKSLEWWNNYKTIIRNIIHQYNHLTK